MNLDEINTEKFFYDPKDKDFVENLQKASDVFSGDLGEVSRKKTLTYTALMYDFHSELRKNISVVPQRRMLAALAAGFKLNNENRFSKTLEDVVCGANPVAARMAAEYCLLSQGNDYMAYTFYQRVFTEIVSSNDSKSFKDIVPLIAKIRSEIEAIENKMLGGDDTLNMRKAIYLSSKQIRLNLQMEDIVDRLISGDDLQEFNPYPDNYIPNKLTYAGEGVPEQQVG